jgi:hypothetical protein
VRPCPWILQATTMRRTAGMENNIGTRVERREKPSDLLTPYYWLDFIQIRLAAPESCAPSRVGVCSVLFLNSDRTRGHRTSLLHFTYSYTPAEQNDPRNSTLR